MSDPELDFETTLRSTLLDRATRAPAGDDLADNVVRRGTAQRRRRRLAGAAAVLVAGVVAGFAGAGYVPFAGEPDDPVPAESPEPPEPFVAIDGPITCMPHEWPAFEPALLTERPPVDPASDFAGELGSITGAAGGGGHIDGATVVGEDDSRASLLIWMADGRVMTATMNRSDEGWSYSAHAECEPELAFDDGLEAAEWSLSGPAPGPDATSIELQVQPALGCSGDIAVEDRLAAPVVDYRDDAVLIAPRLRPLPPGMYDCQGSPPAQQRVELTEPLGDRQLLDGRWYPARPALPALPAPPDEP